MGGLAGADATCNSLASAAGLAGTYKAWLSNGFDSPATRFTRSGFDPLLSEGGYVRTDGVPLAFEFGLFTRGRILAPIDRDEEGRLVSATGNTWTGTTTDGTTVHGALACGGWEGYFSDNPTATGVIGSSSDESIGWTIHDTATCDTLHRHYCFQQ